MGQEIRRAKRESCNLYVGAGARFKITVKITTVISHIALPPHVDRAVARCVGGWRVRAGGACFQGILVFAFVLAVGVFCCHHA